MKIKKEDKNYNKKKRRLFFVIAFILSIGIIATIVSGSNQIKSCEKRIEFFYNPSCPHCEKVSPLLQQFQKQYANWKFYYNDVTQGSYKDINGVPTIKIYPGDEREIILVGSYEIPKYLKCELQEMTTKECPTNLNLIKGSFFIEE